MDGGFADYTLLESRSMAKLPDSLSFQQAAPLMCAGVTIYTAIRRAEEFGLKPGGVRTGIVLRHAQWTNARISSLCE